jgi:hypothetical protein
MKQSVLIGLALVAAYALGTLRVPARAENLEELSTSALLARLITVQQQQADALKPVGKALETWGTMGEATRRDREQTEALFTIAKQMRENDRDQLDALKAIARATERCANK